MALNFLNNGYFGGKLGIGTDSPDTKLSISDILGISGTGNDTYGQIDLVNTQTGASGDEIGPFITFRGKRGGVDSVVAAYGAIGGVNTGTTGNSTGAITFLTKNAMGAAQDLVEQMRISTGGNVGIGTASPQRNLTIYESSGNAVLQLANNTSGVGASDGFLAYTDGVNVGLENKENGYLLFATNASEKMRIAADGNVGIGTASPQYPLHVAGSSSVNAPTGNGVLMGLYAGTYGHIQMNGSSGSYIDFSQSGVDHKGRILYDNGANYLRLDTNGAEKMRITSAGNVGIGTTSPDTKFNVTDGGTQVAISNTYLAHLQSASNCGLAITAGASSNNYIAFGDSDNYDEGIINYNNSTRSFAFRTADGALDDLVIDSAGNVGIGTASPDHKLDVVSAGTNVAEFSGAANATVNFKGSGFVEAKIQCGGEAVFGSTNNFPTSFVTNNTEKMRILANGNVGINTTNPLSILHVVSREIGTGANKGIRIENYNGTKDYSIRTGVSGYENTSLAFYDETAGANRIVIETGGEVGIGSIQPTQKLHVAGNLRVTGAYYDSNNSPGTVNQVLISTVTGTDWIDGSAIPGVPAGSGTVNTIPLWTPDGDTLGDSPITISGNNSTFAGGITATYGNFSSAVNALYFRTAAANTDYNLFTRNNTGNTIFVQAAQSNASQPIAKFSYGSATVNAGTAVLQVSKDNSHFVNCNVGIGTTSPDVKLEVVEASPTDGIVADFVNSTNAGGTIAAIKLSNADSEACDVVLGANRVNANFGADFFISTSDGIDGTNRERFRINENGAVKFNAYDSTNNTGTPTYLIGTDASGNIVKTNTIPGSAAGPYLPLAGGTLTGALAGTSASFTGALSSVGYSGTSGTFSASVTASGNSNSFGNTTTAALTATSGTFTSSVTAAGNSNSFGATTFTSDVIIDASLDIIRNSNNNQLKLKRNGSATGEFDIFTNTNTLFFKNIATNQIPLGIDGSNLATFAGDVTVSGGDLTINSTGNAILNVNGTANSFIEKDTGTDLYIANNVGDKDIKFRVKDNTTNVIALTIDGSEGGNSTFAAQAFSAATSSGDGSSTLTTKGYVDSLITGATIYRGTWNPDKTQNSGYGVPDLSGVTQTSGYYYICSAVGIAEPNGSGCEPNSWDVGDWVIWNDDVVDCAGTGTGAWQKIDNSSVLSGAGTGQTVALWEGASSVTDSETLGNSILTQQSDDEISILSTSATTGQLGKLTIYGYDDGDTNVKNLQLNVDNGGDSNIIASGPYLWLDSANYIASKKVHIFQQDIFMYNNNHIRFLDGPGDSWNDVLGVTSADIVQIGAIASFNTNLGEVAIYSNNTEAIRINVDGNVGIGTTSPVGNLFVGPTWSQTGGNNLYIKSQTTTTSYDPSVNATQDLGITYNTSSTTTTGPDKVGLVLHNDAGVAGQFSPMIIFSGKEATPSQYKAAMAGIYARSPLGTGNLNDYIDGELIFATAGAATKGIVQRMVINKEGNVGIGTDAPGSRLEVYGTDGLRTHFNEGLRVTRETVPTQYGMVNYNGGALNMIAVNTAGTGSVTKFMRSGNGTSLDTSMVIDTSGNVGIGVTSPTAKLQVAGTTTYNSDAAQALRVCDATDVSKGIHIGFDTVVNAGIIQAGDFGVAYGNLSLNPNAGNVGIGTTSPNYTLDVEGEVRILNTIGSDPFTVQTPYDRVGKFISTDAGAFLCIQDSSSTNNGNGINITGDTLTFTTANAGRLDISSTGAVKFRNYDSTNNTGTPTYLLGTDASGNVVKTLTTPSPVTSQAASLYDLIPNGAFTTTYAFTSTAGTYAEVMSGDDVITETGTYSVQMLVNDFAVGGTQYDEKYSGVMTWHKTSTNDANVGAISEIALHRAGHAGNQGITYLRTRETTSADNNELKLEIMCNKTYTSASNVVFKFVRLI